MMLMAAVLTIGLASCDDNGLDGEGEETTFTVEVTNVGPINPVLKSGTFSSPGAGDIGPDLPALFPGESASFTFTAPPSHLPPLGGSGQRLNLATMFVQSNDLFYAFPPEGLDLYDDDGNPTTGDVTDQIFLYDAGTEEDTAPGTGPNQKPAQDMSATDVGPDENENVTLVSNAATNDFDYPDTDEVINVFIEHDGGTEFTVTVTNVSTAGTIDSERAGGSVPLSPGAWAVYENAIEVNSPFAFYELGAPASQGIERIAEDGFPADEIDNGNIDTPIDRGLADAIAEVTGITTPLSPPVLAVHEDGFQVFTVGEAAGEGIETVAEDGFPADMLGDTDLPPPPERALVNILQGQDGVRSVQAMANPGGNVPALEPAPGGPGESVTFTIEAAPGDRLALATMYVQSNDYFFGFSDEGLALFDQNSNPISGDISGNIVLYDAGTEVDEEPGVGLTQKPRQDPAAEDVGTDEGGVIQTVVGAGEDGGMNEGFSYPAAQQIIRVTITPQTVQGQ
jgi:hypothetical protein